MYDFIIDDHDHSHSVTSLSVQLFTVPTLAQYLMGHHEALTALLRCFLAEIERRKNIGFFAKRITDRLRDLICIHSV